MTNPSRKDAAVEFLNLVASGNVREAFSRHVGPGFRHHNAYFRGDANSLMVAMEENAVANPDKALEVHLSLEEGDLVAVFSRVQHNRAELGFALVHIFRFKGDRIAELWDVAQQVPEHSPNENGMF